MNPKVFISVLIFVVSPSLCDAYCNKKASSQELRLKDYLFCDRYDPELRPPENFVPISINYVIRDFDVENDRTFTVQSRFLHRWNDSRLAWKPEDYGDIKGLYVMPELIWVPKIFLNDSHYHYGLGSCHMTKCLIKFSGEVVCQFPCHQTVRCLNDFTDWPFDVQMCYVVFRTMTTQENVTFNPETLNGNVYGNSNKEWKIIQVLATMNKDDPYSVKFDFSVERHYGAIFRHVVVPGYTLIALTLTVLWMKNGSLLRFIVSGSSIYLHFHLADRVYWQYPDSGPDVPRIVKYMTLMVILSTIVLIETILLKFVTEIASTPPIPIQKFSDFMSSNRFAKYFVFSSFDVTVVEKTEFGKLVENESGSSPEEEEIKPKPHWTIFCRVVDRSLFLVLVVCYATYRGY